MLPVHLYTTICCNTSFVDNDLSLKVEIFRMELLLLQNSNSSSLQLGEATAAARYESRLQQSILTESRLLLSIEDLSAALTREKDRRYLYDSRGPRLAMCPISTVESANQFEYSGESVENWSKETNTERLRLVISESESRTASRLVLSNSSTQTDRLITAMLSIETQTESEPRMVTLDSEAQTDRLISAMLSIETQTESESRMVTLDSETQTDRLITAMSNTESQTESEPRMVTLDSKAQTDRLISAMLSTETQTDRLEKNITNSEILSRSEVLVASEGLVSVRNRNCGETTSNDGFDAHLASPNLTSTELDSRQLLDACMRWLQDDNIPNTDEFPQCIAEALDGTARPPFFASSLLPPPGGTTASHANRLDQLYNKTGDSRNSSLLFRQIVLMLADRLRSAYAARDSAIQQQVKWAL